MIETEGKKLSTEKQVVNIDHIKPNPYNPNVMPDYIFQKMKQTIKEKGLFGSIYVHPTAGIYEILDGEHRWKACKELGWKEIPVEVSQEMEENEVKFWTIFFNNTRGKDDIEKRAKIHESMDAGQMQLLPFTEEEIQHEKELFKFDFSQYNNQETIEGKKTNMISLAVTEEIKNLWDRCLSIAQGTKTEPGNMLYQMMNKWLELSDPQYADYLYELGQERIRKTVEADKAKAENPEVV